MSFCTGNIAHRLSYNWDCIHHFYVFSDVRGGSFVSMKQSRLLAASSTAPVTTTASTGVSRSKAQLSDTNSDLVKLFMLEECPVCIVPEKLKDVLSSLSCSGGEINPAFVRSCKVGLSNRIST